jgi:hypothetical protein
MSGTSMAGPHVAGVVALMRSANPNLDVITIKQVLMDTAIDLGPVGEDNTYGHGFVDAYAAVLAVMGGLGWVEGHVVDRATSLPISGARITVEDGFQTAVTTAEGWYRLTLPAGPQVLNVSAFGYDAISMAVDVVEDVTLTRTLPMQSLPSATITGVVYEAGQAPHGATPAAGAIVAVMDTPLAAVTTNAEGEFSFTLPVGDDYVFQAVLSGSGAISQTVPVHGDLQLELFLSQLTQEGFETGDFSAMPWSFAGNANWFVQGTNVHEGNHAARIREHQQLPELQPGRDRRLRCRRRGQLLVQGLVRGELRLPGVLRQRHAPAALVRRAGLVPVHDQRAGGRAHLPLALRQGLDHLVRFGLRLGR